MDKAILNPIIPYIGRIGDGKFTPQKLIKIQGTTPKITHGFDVYLRCGPNFLNDDIALQISVRFLNGYISLNYLRHGIWGKQIQKSISPIETDEKFEICILCGIQQYIVIINGGHFCDFPQIIQHEKISHLSINGGVSVSQICYEDDSVDTVIKNNDGSSGICLDAQSTSSSTNTLLPLNNTNDTAILINSTSTKPAVKCEVVISCVLGVLFVLAILAGFIYWCISDESTNNDHNLGSAYRGGYGWYNRENIEEVPRIVI